MQLFSETVIFRKSGDYIIQFRLEKLQATKMYRRETDAIVTLVPITGK